MESLADRHDFRDVLEHLKKEGVDSHLVGIAVIYACADYKKKILGNPFEVYEPSLSHISIKEYRKKEFEHICKILSSVKKTEREKYISLLHNLSGGKYVENLRKIEDSINVYCMDNAVKKIIRTGIGYAKIGEFFTSDELSETPDKLEYTVLEEVGRIFTPDELPKTLDKIKYTKSKKSRIRKKMDTGKSTLVFDKQRKAIFKQLLRKMISTKN